MVKVGIIGSGRIARVHIMGMTRGVPNAAIARIASPHLTDETAAWAHGQGVARADRDVAGLLKDPALDAVFIFSSTDTHAPLAIEAMERGKHVFLEKPIDLDIDRARSVVEAAHRTGMKLQVGFNKRFDHNFLAVKQAVASGRVGEVQLVKVTGRDAQRPPLDFIAGSGGMLCDMAIHDFDMACYLAGSEAVEVFSYGACLVDPEIGRRGDIDTAVTVLKLKNGAMAIVDSSREAVYGYDQRAEVHGSLGCARMYNDTEANLTLSTVDGVSSGKPRWYFLERYMDSYTAEDQAFINAVERDTPVPVDADAGLHPLLCSLAAKRSVAEGRPVRIAEMG